MRESLTLLPMIHSVVPGQYGLWIAVGKAHERIGAKPRRLTVPAFALRNIMSFSTGLSR